MTCAASAAFSSTTSSNPAARSATRPDALLAKGATEVMAYLTHGVLSGGAVARIKNSSLSSLVITDSIEPTEAVKAARNIRVLSIAPLIAEAIARTAREESVSSLFDLKKRRKG